MKIERLLLIIIYLLNHKRVSAKTLSNQFDVSVRTIQRDIDTLTLAGFPIISFVGIDGGYEIDEQYKMHIQLADDQDYEIILSALKGFNSAFENKKIEKALNKVNSSSVICNSKISSIPSLPRTAGVDAKIPLSPYWPSK